MISVNDVVADLRGRDDSEVVSLWNEYCDEIGDVDGFAYLMDEFDELMEGKSPWEITRMAFYGDFNPNHSFFGFNGYANLISFDFADANNSPIDFESLAEWLIESRPEEVGAEEEEVNEDDIDIVEEA